MGDLHVFYTFPHLQGRRMRLMRRKEQNSEMHIGQKEIGTGMCPVKEQIIQVYPDKFNKLKNFKRNECLKCLFLNQGSFTCSL